MRRAGVALVVLLVVFTSSALAKVSVGTAEGEGFIFISKFCFETIDSENSAKPKLVVEVENAAQGDNSTSGQAVYLFDDEDDSWVKEAHSQDCKEKLKDAKDIKDSTGKTWKNITIPNEKKKTETVSVTETRRPHWWYVAVANCGGKVNAKYTVTFTQADGSQFGFDKKGIYVLYIFFFVLYTIGFAAYMLNLVKQVKEAHVLVKRFSVVYGLQLVSMLCIIIHLGRFSATGEGVGFLNFVGTLTEELSILGLIILCMWVASGCNKSIKERGLFLPVALAYSALSLIMIIYYHATRSSSWSTNFIYDQWPGILLMVFRLAVSVLFLAMIRPTFLLERAADKRVFYRWFSTAVSLWMAAIPVVVFLCEAVVSYWQVRVTEALLLVMNGIVFGILSLLMRPTRMAAMFPATQTFQESFLTGVPDLGSYVPPADPHMI